MYTAVACNNTKMYSLSKVQNSTMKIISLFVMFPSKKENIVGIHKRVQVTENSQT